MQYEMIVLKVHSHLKLVQKYMSMEMTVSFQKKVHEKFILKKLVFYEGQTVFDGLWLHLAAMQLEA